MRILIVDNKTLFIKNIKRLLRGHEVEVKKFNEIKVRDANKFDVVILSGGYEKRVKYHRKRYLKEIRFIRECKRPVFGICLGFQLICYVFRCKLKRLERPRRGIVSLKIIKNDPIFKGIKKLKVVERHEWAVKDECGPLEVLAVSKDGIEVVKHRKRMIYGVQFHPEVKMNSNGYKIVKNFLKMVEKNGK